MWKHKCHASEHLMLHPRVRAIREDAREDRLVGAVAGNKKNPFKGAKHRFSDSKSILRFKSLCKLTEKERRVVFMKDYGAMDDECVIC